MIDRVKYPFSYWIALLATDGKLENPCQIDLTDIDLAFNRLLNPSLISEKKPKEKVYTLLMVDNPSVGGVQNWDSTTKILTTTLPEKKTLSGRVGNIDIEEENRKYNNLVSGILNALQLSVQVFVANGYAEKWKLLATDEVQNECALYRRSTVVYTPVLQSDYVLKFTDPLLKDRGVTLESVIAPIKEQIAPAFLDYENTIRRLTALRQQKDILTDDIDIYNSRISTIQELIARDATDAWDTLIKNYGSTCTPLMARLQGVLEQGTMERTGLGKKWGGNRNWSDAWWCRNEMGMPPYFATHAEAIADAGSQESIRGQQRDMVRARLDRFISERTRLESLLKRVSDKDIPEQEKKVEAATQKWNETQKVVVDFLTKVADAQKTAAEANNYAAIVEAERQKALAAEETKRQLQAIEAKEGDSKRRSQTLMVIAGAAIGISLLSRGQQGGSATNTLISVGALGLLGYGAYTYMKTSETEVVVNPNESNTQSPQATSTRNYIAAKLANRVSSLTVRPNRTTEQIVDEMIDPRTGRGVQRTASNFYGFLPH